jgi:hypothetical protein
MKRVRITSAELIRAKFECDRAGVSLKSCEKRPDGTICIGFHDYENAEVWRNDT